MSQYEREAALEPITFGGLLQNVNDLRTPVDRSPDMLNIDLLRDGSIAKRTGYDELDNQVTGTGALESCLPLMDIANGKNYLFAARNGTMNRYDVGAGTWHEDEVHVLTVGATYRGAMSYYGSSYEQALYIVNGEDEPLVGRGTQAADYANPAQNIQSATGGAAGTDVYVNVTSHGMADGDYVKLSGITTSPWTAINGVWRIEVKDVNEFYLLDPDNDWARYETPGNWTTPLGTEGTADCTYDQIARWPKGVYSAAGGTRGYPSVWDDPNADGGTGWPGGTVQDWPSGITMVGSGVSVRSLAWGFALDPDRIDYSELGEPVNYLKRDVDAADEASAASVPAVDGGYFYCMRGDGDRVVEVVELFDRLVVFKSRRTFVYTGFIGVDLALADIIPVGTSAPRSVVRVGNDIYFWSSDGPRSLAGSDQYGDIKTGQFGRDVLDVIRRVSTDGHGKIVAVHDRENQRIIWYVPLDEVPTNTHALVYYYERGQYVIWDGARCEVSDACELLGGILTTPRLYASHTDGKAALHGVGYADGEDTIAAHYTTKWFVEPHMARRKRLNMVDVLIGANGVTGNTKFYIGWDYLEALNELTAIHTAHGNQATGVWGLSKWGVDFIWGDTSSTARRYGIEGSGHLYRFKVEDDSVNNFEIAALIPQVLTGGTR